MEKRDKYEDLLSKCEDELICLVCEEWCSNPVILRKCGHYFCRSCIPPIENSCPKCKEIFFADDIEIAHSYSEIRKDIQFYRTCVDLLLGDLTEKVIIEDTKKDDQSLPFKINFVDSKSLKKNVKGESMLHIACKRKNLLEVKQLIQENVDINSKDYAGWTPLHEAIQSESTDIVMELLTHKVLIDVPGEFYVTPLHKAVLMENIDIIKLLVQNGADKEVVDFYGRKPSDLTKNNTILKALNNTTNNIECQKPYVYLSNKIVAYCHSIDKEYKNKITSLKNVKVVSQFNIDKQELTHLLVKKSHKVSFKILLSMLGGLMIVRQEWIDHLPKGMTIPTELVLEKEVKLSNGIRKALISHLSNKPKLFDGMRFYLEISDISNNVYGLTLQKEILKKLILTGGGVILSRAPAPRVVEESRLFPYHASLQSTTYGCSNIIIFSEQNPPKLQYKMKELQHKSCKWLLDCIINYELL